MNRRELINKKTIISNEANKVCLKSTSAITLITLVITIILLIILAGIVINLSIGENGIFNKAKYAKEEYLRIQNREQQELNELDDEIDVVTGNINPFEKILKICKIEGNYTIEDLAINKDEILTIILENKQAINYIVNNEEIFLKILTDSEIAIMELVQNKNFKQAIMDKENWVKNIIEKGSNITGFEEKCDTISKMTSNISEEGEIIVSACDDRVLPIHAFDKNSETYWMAENLKTEPSTKPYIMYKYSENHNIYKIYIEHKNTTNGQATETLELYISEKEEGDDSWIKVYEETYSYGHNTAGTPHNITCKLDKITSVRRIKVNSLIHCTSDNWWNSLLIYEVKAYGI